MDVAQIVILSLVILIANQSPVLPIKDINESTLTYLTKFGYLKSAKSGQAFLMDKNSLMKVIMMMMMIMMMIMMMKAVKKFQSYGGVSETGVMDDATLGLMRTPRCGNPDDVKSDVDDSDLDGDVDDDVPDINDAEDNVQEAEEDDVEDTNDDHVHDVVDTDDDVPGVHAAEDVRRMKRFAVQGSRWKKRVLSYSVGRYPSQLTRAEVDTDVRRAFNMWQQVMMMMMM